MRRSLLAIFALVLGMSACGGGGGSGSGGGINARGGTERAYTRNDGAVTSTLNPLNSNYTATRTVTISNDDAGATRGVVALAAGGASITSSPNASGYQIQVTLTVTAPSDAQARQELAAMGVAHRDGVAPGVLYLDTQIDTGTNPPNGVNRNATATAMLPQALSYELAQSAGGGSVTSSGLHGTRAEFYAGGGNVTLGGTWDSAVADTGGGSVTVTADVARLAASAGGGSVTATLPSTRDTEATLDTGGGAIDVSVSHAGNGVFDAEATTGGGATTIAIVGTSAVGVQTANHKHYRSPNFESGSPKIRVAGRAGGGSVTIHD